MLESKIRLDNSLLEAVQERPASESVKDVQKCFGINWVSSESLLDIMHTLLNPYLTSWVSTS